MADRSLLGVVASLCAERQLRGQQWDSRGRSAETAARAARFTDAGDELFERAEIVLSVCPPDQALAVAEGAAAFGGIYVDANAIAPATAARIDVPHYVDGGIIGSPAAPRLDVAHELHAEWSESQPDLAQRLQRAEAAADAKGWRWAGEMREIAATFAAAGLPPGFHEAAAGVYERDRR